jgi:hypothetical protein
MRRAAAIAVAAAALLSPASAAAHGLVGRAYLPVPAWLFAWAAGAVLIVSFFALGRLWSAPRLEPATPRRWFPLPTFLQPVCGALGIALLVVIVYSGIRGTQIPTNNIAPTVMYVIFWVGVPVLSALLGDFWPLFSPWRALARACAWTVKRAGLSEKLGDPLPYPGRLGRWPAVAGLLGFAWLELVYVNRDRPSTLALLTAGYALVQLVGMALFGIEDWSRRGDAFAVAFNAYSQLSPLEYRGGSVYGRRPLSGLTSFECYAGTVPLLCTMIGTTTFDGLSNGPVWRSVQPSLVRDLERLGLSGPASVEIIGLLGLVACVLLCIGVYWVGILGMGSISEDHPARQLRRRFVHSLVPIAAGYLVAHYFSLLVTQGQAIASLISNPLGTGANVFGTAGFQVDWALVSASLIWYVQVAALVAGHVSGLAVAHDRALVVYGGDAEEATLSQRWMLVVMVTFTCFGLWLLSAVNT